MLIEQVKVESDKLVKGMYVCALDRPWLSTSFPFQGFKIRGKMDIAEIQKCCTYVYVDVRRGVAPESTWIPQGGWDSPVFQVAPNAQQRKRARVDDRKFENGIRSRPIPINRDFHPVPKRFGRELKTATRVNADINRAVSQVVDDIRVGRKLDVSAVRGSLGLMVDSIVRHPDAFVWMTKLRQKDAYAYGHGVRSSVYSVVLGRHLGLSERHLQTLAMGTLLCQIGKAKLPNRLLQYHLPLSEEQLQQLRGHVGIGVEILNQCFGISDEVIEIVQNYCERFDGSGYPNHKSGEMIPMPARIAGLVDCYDAMTSIKPYTDRVASTSEAMEFLYSQRGEMFQQQLIEEFIQALGIYPTGTLVELSTGHISLIQNQNLRDRIQPEILLVLDHKKQAMGKYEKVDLRDFNQRHPDRPVSIKRALAVGEYGLDPSQIMAAHAAQNAGWRAKVFGQV
jgi:HD-GYP domain-containing protein (c-di-GMP phosphodiesterase class II)